MLQSKNYKFICCILCVLNLILQNSSPIAIYIEHFHLLYLNYSTVVKIIKMKIF